MLAGIVWLVAGLNVCKIGITTWMSLPNTTIIMTVGSLLTLAAFSAMFVKMVFKNFRRIQQIDVERRKVWHMMSVKSYIIMAFMITLGITLRHSPYVPAQFIASFYVGLGSALSLAGLTYLGHSLLTHKDT